MSDSLSPFIRIEENQEAACALGLLRQAVTGSAATAPVTYLAGPTGCGKTHLLRHQIRELARSHPRLRHSTRLVSHWATELSEAERTGTLYSLIERSAKLDVLVLDECEWLDGRHIEQMYVKVMIDRFQWDGPILVFASRKPVGEFDRCLPQLANRWLGGINASVGFPGAAGRETLVRAFAAERQLALTDGALRLVRDELLLAPRELRQVVDELDGLARRNNSVVDAALVEAYLAKYRGEPIVAVDAVLDAVAREFGVTIEELTSRSRHQGHVIPRQCAMLLIRELTGQPLERIGSEFGNRNRTTISHGCDRVRQLLPEMPSLRQRVNRLRRSLRETRLPRRA